MVPSSGKKEKERKKERERESLQDSLTFQFKSPTILKRTENTAEESVSWAKQLARLGTTNFMMASRGLLASSLSYHSMIIFSKESD